MFKRTFLGLKTVRK